MISFFKKKQAQKIVKHFINIEQNGHSLRINGELTQSSHQVKEIWIISRDSSNEFMLGAIQPSNEFDFHLNFNDIHQQIHSSLPEVYDFYLKVCISSRLLSPEEIENLMTKKGFRQLEQVENDIEYFIRLGRFKQTNINGLATYENGEDFSTPFLTKKGNLSYAYNEKIDVYTKLQIEKVKSQKNHLYLNGRIFTHQSQIISGNLLVKGRLSEIEILLPVSFNHLQEETKQKYGLNRYIYTAELPLQTIYNGGLLDEDIYDLYLIIKFQNEPEEKIVRIGRPTYRTRFSTKEANAFLNGFVANVNPYYTFKASNLSLEVFKFDEETFLYMSKLLKWSWLLRNLNRNKDIWLVGERPYKAQDTGYHFFKYMRESHPNKNVFYVMDESSPEYRNVEPFGNVLRFKSKEHIWHTIMARKIISSHHADYLYPVRSPRFVKAVKATRIFLQHGVMGTKNMIANYGKKAIGFNTDAFLVSSDFEKDMIVNDFEYEPEDVFVTGLSRFDSLLRNDVKVKRQLLIIPTWRDWIGSSMDFTETEYFQRYHQLIHDKSLHSMAEKYHFEIIFCLHPNMQIYTPYFKDAPVKVISQGEVDVQTLLKESAIMITDYSSVAFDFSFLHKPIIYYQFDRNRFIGKRPSHLDLDNDLPGDIVFSQEDLLGALESYAINDFKMTPENVIRSNKFLKYRDCHANERIYEVIQTYKKKRHLVKQVSEGKIATVLFRKFRRSKYYFPAMKLFYRIAKKVFPVDKKLMLFESSIGKQYADSPRYIYEEIQKRNLDYKIVWVCNRNDVRFTDPNTKKITRLSPSYYYYLARAKFWFNNQNFPTYLGKRKETTYIQTWHGTPLKKMLFDIETIHGRDEDYLNRVAYATKQWDYLLSPSNYATKAFKSAFRYDGNILELGYPRNDLFYKENVEEITRKVKNRINIPKEKKVILYAPTFRDNQKDKNKFVFDMNLDIQELYENLADEYVLLLRMHIVVSNKLTIPEEYSDFVFNVSSYPEIQELYLISDILMTDYSSVMFDFAHTGRPILYYTYDLEEYRDSLRGFYMDFVAEAPGPFLKTTSDIVSSVKNIENISSQFQDRYSAFQNKYCDYQDADSSKRVVDYFFRNKG
ncbi:CDP-glycerol glycerophosphotransferase family protein [Bacillus sp. FJAT-49736]|uniref:CDP-glycerol glycerophosphotransferase family protein n=1 Tax=Bacillus sp. FJAT-49736 TaxID=2833582 RepID=UPI001BCA01AB|nr:CDP-glycerol glycerophosphotransferase family protein [Bacillus sp. FJAT-49736]MBS4174055.1 CDP-glycerol glycerophosphotransferase family protein [Bacillus sp. FJAT-49736]